VVLNLLEDKEVLLVTTEVPSILLWQSVMWWVIRRKTRMRRVVVRRVVMRQAMMRCVLIVWRIVIPVVRRMLKVVIVLIVVYIGVCCRESMHGMVIRAIGLVVSVRINASSRKKRRVVVRRAEWEGKDLDGK
jgi:hypothetical protein